jgi:hypothetical protein
MRRLHIAGSHTKPTLWPFGEVDGTKINILTIPSQIRYARVRARRPQEDMRQICSNQRYFPGPLLFEGFDAARGLWL